MSSQRKFRRLHVQALEDRSVPAAFSYLAGTLTVTTEEGENLFISPSINAPAGYLRVLSIQSQFDSLVNNQPVSNLIVKMGATNAGSLDIDTAAFIPGHMTIFGAKQSTNVVHRGDVGKNFTYQAAPGGAADSLSFANDSSIGGNLLLNLGAGFNLTNITGGGVGGNLVVNGGNDGDSVTLAQTDDVIVAGSATFNLGSGLNQFVGLGNDSFKIGKNFTYTGGVGVDSLDTTAVTALEIGGNMKVNLGSATGGANQVDLVGLAVGGTLAIAGGKNTDTVNIVSGGIIGGNMTLSLGDGDNSADLAMFGCGGSFNYVGGLDADSVAVDQFHVLKNMSVNAKGSRAGIEQQISLGSEMNEDNVVNGNLSITAGHVNNFIRVARTTIGGNLKVKTGDRADEIYIDDTSVSGAALFELGAANDQLSIDNLNSDGGGNLSGLTTFGGTFTVKAGAGNDFVALSSNGGTYIKFGGKVSLFGGVGTDTFNNTIFNNFYSAGNIEDFETDAGTPLPV